MMRSSLIGRKSMVAVALAVVLSGFEGSNLLAQSFRERLRAIQQRQDLPGFQERIERSNAANPERESFQDRINQRVSESDLALPEGTPVPLDEIKVPEIEDLEKFVVDREAARVLGKALFWDMQVGSDGKTACASCHFQAGVDNRVVSTLHPGGGTLQSTTKRLRKSDFPFHRIRDPRFPASSSNPVMRSNPNVVGSSGVVKKNFIAVNSTGSPVDAGLLVADAIFRWNGSNTRRVTNRNAPSTINAVYNDRQFWDGRANRFFNGVNAFGDTDPNANIWRARRGRIQPVKILLDNGSLASQAVAPANSPVEAAWNGRNFPDLAVKLLNRVPLQLQEVHTEDSVLGLYANPDGPGLCDVTYADLVKRAFRPQWWRSRDLVDIAGCDFTLMEANFSLFWGLSVSMYEATLISDETPFDAFASGELNALTEQEVEGLKLFLNEGKCINCHSGPQFTGATIDQLRSPISVGEEEGETLIEFMVMGDKRDAFYDASFYNIGVRPTEEDLGVGGAHPVFGPFSLSRRVQDGQDVDLNGDHVSISPGDRLAVNGAFKTPGLRNIELTGPYMHNGGMKSLEEVVLFYLRGADFRRENKDDLDPDVDGVKELQGDDDAVAALVAFMKALTDERVRNQSAPFDHPQLFIPRGFRGATDGEGNDLMVEFPAVGRRGGARLVPYEKRLK